MLQINNLKTISPIEYEGIFVIETNNIDELISNFYKYEIKNLKTVFEIENSEISIKNAIIVSPLTKLEELYNLSAKNILTKIILNNENLDVQAIFNNDKFLEEIDKINDWISDEFLTINMDKIKIMKNLISLDDEKFISEKTFEKWLGNFESTNKQLIILKDFTIPCATLSKYLNKFNFLVITNNLFSIIENLNELECCAFEKQSNLYQFISTDSIKIWFEDEYNVKNVNSERVLEELKNNEFKQIKLKKQLI
ncbi:hypothetical protein OF364_01995 [Mycoplasma enhydrae]|uniref:hypothetical protein n=1 Tax=Mycoplasma enhydrae TaxID=2499220 RepID=UPI0021E88066|nr:hypothetical protein [Mycoplasma enhydrae]MCV3753583.1 hypothetical protein [Mycoplasma enhydrae]